MKKFVIFAVLICLVLGCCGCSDTGTKTDESGTQSQTGTQGDSNVASVGDVLSAPEKVASFKDFSSLTLNVKATSVVTYSDHTDKAGMDIVCAFRTLSSGMEYYLKADGTSVLLDEGIEPYFEEIYCLVKEGTEYAYVTYNDSNDPAEAYTESTVGDVLGYLADIDGIESNEQFMKEFFAYYGINYENYYGTDIKFEKCEDETVNGFDCYVYNIISNDDSITYEKIHVDKTTGLWVRDEYVMNEDGTIIKEIFEIISFSEKVNIPEYDIAEF